MNVIATADRLRVQWHDECPAPLRRCDHARLELAPRSTRTIRSKCHGAASLQLADRPEERPSPAAGAGPGNGAIAERRRKTREITTLACLAYYHGNALVAMLPEERK